MLLRNTLNLLFLWLFISHNSILAVGTEKKYCKNKRPKFSDYPIVKTANKKKIRLDFTKIPETKRFRTQYKNAAKRGINFAGNFIIMKWGCGTSCQVFGIIDGKTGVTNGLKLSASHDAVYRSNSNLIIVDPETEYEKKNGFEIQRQAYGMPRYYLFDVKTQNLELVCEVKFKLNSDN